MRIVYCCIFKSLKILNLGSLILLTIGGKLKKDVSLLSLLSSLLSCFLLSLQQGLSVWPRLTSSSSSCAIPAPRCCMSSTRCHAGGIIFLVLNTWHSRENTGLRTSDGPCNTMDGWHYLWMHVSVVTLFESVCLDDCGGDHICFRGFSQVFGT